MTKKADFNADEWSKVVEGPVLAGMKVIAADRGGTIRESLAMGQVYNQARQQQGESELLDALVSSPPALDPARMRSAGDIGRRAARGSETLYSCSSRRPLPRRSRATRVSSATWPMRWRALTRKAVSWEWVARR